MHAHLFKSVEYFLFKYYSYYFFSFTEKTVIFTSSSQVTKCASNKEPEILISSSSWIDLQSIQYNGAINTSINEDLEESNHKLDESLCVLSSPNIDVKDEVIRIKEISEVNLDSLEPVKPPRLKKLARLQQQQLLLKKNDDQDLENDPQLLKWQASKESLEQHLKDR